MSAFYEPDAEEQAAYRRPMTNTPLQAALESQLERDMLVDGINRAGERSHPNWRVADALKRARADERAKVAEALKPYLHRIPGSLGHDIAQALAKLENPNDD